MSECKDRVNRYDNNRCINCGAKAGHDCYKGVVGVVPKIINKPKRK